MMHPHQTSSSTRPAAAAVNDIVVAYKELKKFLLLSKDEAQSANNLVNQYTAVNKPYMKNTVSMMQHSKQNMNKDLLRFSLEKSKLPRPPLFFITTLV